METHGTWQPSGADEHGSSFRMINVGEKQITKRRALAEGWFYAAPATITRIRDKTLPKGDVLALAEVAGILGAKKTAEVLPLCHPLPLDAVRVWTEVFSDSVKIVCEAVTSAKTGVEMEALNGVMTALLCIYDLTKGIDPVLSISGVRLNFKEGGKSGVWHHPEVKVAAPKNQDTSYADLRVGVVTVSDRCSRGEATDTSGPAIFDFMFVRGAQVLPVVCVADEKEQIQKAVRQMVLEKAVNLVVTTGGTGLGPRDVTPEAIFEMGAKSIPGVGELLRQKGAAFTKMSWLSRGEGALFEHALVVMLPGSEKAVREGLMTLEDLWPHALHTMTGGGHK